MSESERTLFIDQERFPALRQTSDLAWRLQHLRKLIDESSVEDARRYVQLCAGIDELLREFPPLRIR